MIGDPAGELRYVLITEKITYRVPIIYTPDMSDEEAGNSATDALANADEEEADKWVVKQYHTATLV